MQNPVIWIILGIQQNTQLIDQKPLVTLEDSMHKKHKYDHNNMIKHVHVCEPQLGN